MTTYEILSNMSDAAEYPRTIETQRILSEIAMRHVEQIKADGAKVTPAEKLQKKALSISLNMAHLCNTFVSMMWGSKSVGEFVGKRMNIIRSNGCTDGLEDQLAALTPDEIGMFAVFAHATWFLHNAFFDKHTAEIHAAYQNGHPERAFEANIIINVLNAVCRDWHEWWRANGTAPFEKWTYDTHPADQYIHADTDTEGEE